MLAHLGTLNPARIGGEYFKELRFLSATAKGNLLDAMKSKPAEQMTKEVARTLAAKWSAEAAITIKGFDPPLDAGGITFFELFGAMASQDSANSQMKKDEAKLMRVVSLALDLLREDRAELSEAEIAGAWWLVGSGLLSQQPAACLHAVQAGAVGLAIDELRTGAPADWVSVERNPSGRDGTVLNTIRDITGFLLEEHVHLLAATPRLLGVFLDGLPAFEAAAAPEDANAQAVNGIGTGLYMYHAALFELSSVNRAAVRGAASGIRYILDNPVPCAGHIHISTSTWTVRLLLPESSARG